MNKALKKYYFLCVIGLCFLILTVVFIVRHDYSLIFVSAFIGVMILNAAGKRISCLKTAGRALNAGQKEVLVYYRDGNMEESKNVIIPVRADTNWL